MLVRARAIAVPTAVRRIASTLAAGALAVGLALGHASTVLASNPPTQVADLTRFGLDELLGMTVETASRRSERLVDAPVAVTVITRAEIREHGFRTLGDVLRTVPGVWITNDRNYEYAGVRGFIRPGDYNSRLLLLIDGRRVNDLVFDTAPLDRSFPLDLGVVERIEFVPGPGSALYGANAFFGVINVITRRGVDEGARLSVGTGSSRSSEAALTVSRRFQEGLELLLSASGYHSRGQSFSYPELAGPTLPDGRIAGLDGERARRAHLDLSHSGWRVTGTLSERRKELPTAPFGTVPGASGTRTTDEYTLLSLRRDLRLAVDTDLALTLTHNEYRLDGHYMLDSGGLGVPPWTRNTDETRVSWSGIDLRIASTRIAGHRIVAGLETERAQRAQQRNFDVDPFVSYLDASRRFSRIGLYVQDQFSLGDSLEITAGLRHDRHSASVSITTPRLAAVWRAAPGTAVRALAGVAYRAPNAFELDYQAPGFGAAGRLQAERIATWEAGIDQALGFAGLLRARAFRYNLHDLIEFGRDPVSGLLRFANAQAITATGVTLEMQRQWPSGARARASATWSRSHDGRTGEPISHAPKVLGKLTVGTPLPLPGVFAALDAQHVGRRVADDGSTTPAYTLANLTLSSDRVARDLTLSASVYNLFDRRYADPGSPDFRQTSLPQERRQLWLRASLVWR